MECQPLHRKAVIFMHHLAQLELKNSSFSHLPCAGQHAFGGYACICFEPKKAQIPAMSTSTARPMRSPWSATLPMRRKLERRTEATSRVARTKC